MGEPWASPEQIRRARETLGLSQQDVSELLAVDIQTIEKWETGKAAPDPEDLYRLGEELGRPLSYFFSATTSPPPRQDFRLATGSALADITVRRAVIARFEELCRFQATVEELSGLAPKAIPLQGVVERIPPRLSADALASAVRTLLGIGSEPIKDMPGLIESLGVRLFVVPMPGAGVAGTSWWHRDFGPAVLLNRSESSTRRTFTLAHELAHLLKPDGQAVCGYIESNAVAERQADSFAAAFLIPELDLIEFIQPLIDADELGGWQTADRILDRVSRRYGTSREATALRLEKLGMLPDGFTGVRRAVWNRQRQFLRSRGTRWRRRLRDLGKRHLDLTLDAYREGRLSLSSVADGLLLDPDQAYELLSQTTGHGEPVEA